MLSSYFHVNRLQFIWTVCYVLSGLPNLVSPSNCSATQLVLKAHKEAVNTLSGNGSTKLGTVAAVVAAANSTALEASKEIEAAMQVSMKNALGTMLNRTPDFPMDDLSIMKVRKSFLRITWAANHFSLRVCLLVLSLFPHYAHISECHKMCRRTDLCKECSLKKLILESGFSQKSILIHFGDAS